MMRRFVLAFVALLIASSAYAAFWQGQTALTAVPQITCNIVTGVASVGGPCASPAASCVGDEATVTRNVTMVTTPSPANKNLNVSVNTFAPSDVGKLIKVPGASGGAGTLQTTIAAYVDPQNVTLTSQAFTGLTGASTAITYGHDDAPAFAAFNTWARANQGSSQVVLTVPNGSNCWFGSGNFGIISVANPFAAGINNLIVEGTGASIEGGANGGGFWLGGIGVCQLPITTGCTARIQGVSPGATQVTLTASSLAAGYVSRFVVGRWLMVAGLNPQAISGSGSGDPPNQTFFEWRQITNVNAGTGVITLDRALTKTYLDTWPLYNDGVAANKTDQGGPATIYALDATWSGITEYRGLSIRTTGTGNQIYTPNRSTIYRNVTFPSGTFGAIPTQNETWTAINTVYGDAFPMETDKLVGTMTMNGVTINRIDFQSSSTDQFIVSNSTINILFGSGNTTTIADTTFGTLRPGAFSYGATLGPFTCTRCKVTTAFQPLNGGIAQDPNPSLTSMSGGVISFLNSDETGINGPPARVYVPGGNVMFNATGYGTLGIFNIQTVTQDATNTYVQTNQAGGFPDLTTLGGAPIGFHTQQAPQFSCTSPDPASVPDFIGACVDAGATALAPMGTFAQRTFTPTVQTNNLGDMVAWGKIVSLTIDITTPSTHTGSITLNPTGQSHLFTIKQSNWTQFDWMPALNAKQPGKRVYTNSGSGTGSWTCDTGGGPSAGGCSGDTVTGAGLPPEQVWIQSQIGPGIFGVFTGGVNPTFTITIKTDQTP